MPTTNEALIRSVVAHSPFIHQEPYRTASLSTPPRQRGTALGVRFAHDSRLRRCLAALPLDSPRNGLPRYSLSRRRRRLAPLVRTRWRTLAASQLLIVNRNPVKPTGRAGSRA
ncbi:hypothetical protein [Haladaptatus sp. DFWS20]|uniref:hypothetical protein n=1 Tax=Haladaptatus sp. DFWS20 TaxID=3403467 RepID=UPI003EB6D8D1